MSRSRPSAGSGPVVLNGDIRRNRRPIRSRDTSPLPEPSEEPLPGKLLVLLSRLHRAEDSRRGAGED